MKPEKTISTVILAAGLGTRLRPYTLFMPKSMLPLGDKPVLEHIILWLKKFGIKEILVSVGYMRRIIEDHFKDGSELGVKITYVKAGKLLGTGGQLKDVEKHLNETFVCLYGDSVYDFRLDRALSLHMRKDALATIVVMPYKTTLRYGFIDVNSSGAVTGWREKPQVNGLINIGCYIMQPKFLKYIPRGTMHGMNSAFEHALHAGERIIAYVARGNFIDIGDKRSYMQAHEKYLAKLGKIP